MAAGNYYKPRSFERDNLVFYYGERMKKNGQIKMGSDLQISGVRCNNTCAKTFSDLNILSYFPPLKRDFLRSTIQRYVLKINFGSVGRVVASAVRGSNPVIGKIV